MLTRIALAVTLLAASSIAATNAYAARGVSIANFGHNFGGGRYSPPQPTLRGYFPPEPTLRRQARVIPNKPPLVNGYTGPNGPTCHWVSIHSGLCTPPTGPGIVLGCFICN